MVVLSAAVTTKNGKALLSRQFVELSKVRIEGLLAAFPKLMGTEKQHTFVETENIRYVYQPMENLYILLITNKASNIMEDLETLHLLAKIVPEFCRVLDEKEVLKHAFDLIFAFDEAIAMGYKERVNLQQIKHFLAMESNDELRAKQEQKTKEILAKKAAEKKRKELAKMKLEQKRGGYSDSGSGGYSGSSSSSSGQYARSNYIAEPVVETKREAPKSAVPSFSKGMQLGKGKGTKASDYSKVLQEENVPDVPSPSVSSNQQHQQQQQHDIPPGSKVHTSIQEKIVLVAENDGGLKNMEVKGELALTVNDPNCTRIKVHISQGQNEGFQFKTHPNMNKTAFSTDNTLALKDPGKAYPTVTPTSILKWRYVAKDDKEIPLTINVWPSTSGSETTVPVEFEKHCNFDLHDVDIIIPIPAGTPVVGEVTGSTEFESRKGLLHWRVPLIDSSSNTGSMEFTVPAANASSFFPVHVSFRSNTTFCALQVVAVSEEGSNSNVEFTQDTSLTVEQYDIE